MTSNPESAATGAAVTPVRPARDLAVLDVDDGGGLVTVVTCDAHTGVVLMVASADREALEHTIATGAGWDDVRACLAARRRPSPTSGSAVG